MVHQTTNMSEWKHVLTVEKAEFTDDGPWYIEGVVAGPGYVDSVGDEFLPTALQQVADHINQFGLPLMDWHGKGHVNTIVDAEMGEISKAWFDDEGLLHVGGELDKTVPASQWLRGKTDPKLLPEGKEPKKFGLSLHGVAQNVRPVLENGKIKRLIADTLPDEISLTTRPYYQPSLGTVISKAIDEAAAESVAGDKSSMSDEVTPQVEQEVKPETETDSEKVETAAADAGVETTPDSEAVGDAAESTDNVTVEKSESEQRAAEFVEVIRNIVRQEIGNSKVEPVVPSTASEPAEVVVEKSEDDRLTIIEKAVLEMGATLERVLENVPETRAPGVLIAKSQEDELRETFAQMSPSEKLRAGFALTEQKLR